MGGILPFRRVRVVMDDAAQHADALAMRALVERAQRGDAAAFEALYRTYVPQVNGVCLRLCGTQARATELTQDVFVRVWERIGSFRHDSAFGTWIHRVAVNLVLGTMRNEQRRSDRVWGRLAAYQHAGRGRSAR